MTSVARIRLKVPANKAKPSPSIGQALGSLGINMMKFCKEFNEKSVKFKDDLPLRVKLSVLNDGSYNFSVHAPFTSYFLKKCAGLDKASARPGHEIVGKVHAKQIYEIAKIKQNDNEELALTPLESIYRSIVHSCKGMGLEVDYSKENELKAQAKNRPRVVAQPAAAAAKGKGGKPAPVAAKPAAAKPAAAKPAAPAAPAKKK
jgi:large subunit ribosomal protein L11